jgi:hypothetical protein
MDPKDRSTYRHQLNTRGKESKPSQWMKTTPWMQFNAVFGYYCSICKAAPKHMCPNDKFSEGYGFAEDATPHVPPVYQVSAPSATHTHARTHTRTH